jgi:hypothetical protein
VPPIKPTMEQVRLQKEDMYDMVTPMIPPGATIKGDILGAIGNLRYSDHDLEYLKKFPMLVPHKYLCKLMNLRSLVIPVELKEWATRF